MMKTLFLTSLFLSTLVPSALATPDYPKEQKKNAEVPGISAQELAALFPKPTDGSSPSARPHAYAIAPENLATLLATKFNKSPIRADDGLEPFPTELLGAGPPNEDSLRQIVGKVKAEYPRVHAQKAKPNAKYDVIIQMGHYGRTKGATGGAGKRVTEQEMAAFVGVKLVTQLAKYKVDGQEIKTLLVGAGDLGDSLKTKIFLALHTDAAEPTCNAKPSVGYAAQGDANGMHGIACTLALTLGLDAEGFMKDNYTKNLSGYYAYKHVTAEYFKGVLEMSELTCPTDEDRLLANADLLATNLAVALQFALRPSATQ